ncbi:hypothetical protein MMC07_003651 [Pseudocyphellaria aurata]|nr:hypothetical protein [Pseudocyphellaria aurata]
MSFHKLPNEILVMILWSIQPADVLSFSMICRHVRNLSGPMVREHKALSSKYWHLELLRETVPSTLTDYCTGFNRLSHYPTLLDIMPWDRSSPFNQVPSGTLDLLSAMAKQTGLIPDHRVRRWFGEISSIDTAITPFLITYLPNLQILRFIGRKREGLPRLAQIVRAVVESQRRSENSQALSRLFSLVVTNGKDKGFTELKHFLSFLELPSMREMICRLVHCQGLERLPFAPRSSLVKHLRFDESLIPSTAFSVIFSAFEALQVFQYSPFRSQDFNPRAMRNALLKHQRHTLKELNIESRGRPHSFMGALSAFTGLKIVKLNSQMLCDGMQTSRLVMFFPSSIQSIEITGGLEDEAEEQLFSGFSLSRESAVPDLRTVYAHDDFNTWPNNEPDPIGKYIFKYRNISELEPDSMFKKRSWNGLEAVSGHWIRFGNGVNKNIFAER